MRRSTFFCRLNATQQRLSVFWQNPWAERTIPRPRNQYRLIRRRSRGSIKAEGVLEEDCQHRPVQYLIMSWNRTTGSSNVEFTQASIFAPSSAVSKCAELLKSKSAAKCGYTKAKKLFICQYSATRSRFQSQKPFFMLSSGYWRYRILWGPLSPRGVAKAAKDDFQWRIR